MADADDCYIDSTGNGIFHSIQFGHDSNAYGKINKISSSGDAVLNDISANNITASKITLSGNYITMNSTLSSIAFRAKSADNEYHTIVGRKDDMLTTYLGWSGNSICDTVTMLRGKTVCVNSTEIAVESDERLKNSFEPLDKFNDVYMNLKPLSFLYNQGTSGRKHFGFGAKQIKESFEKYGFTTKDFAGFVQLNHNPNSEKDCNIEDPMYLRYTEFISLNTHMIQKLYKENETLKQRILKLEQAMV